MSLLKYVTLDYWFTRSGYVKGANLEITSGQPLTDEDIERIDLDFARRARETVQWLSANNTDVAAIVSTDVSGIIGSSISIQSRIPNARELNKAIEKYIRRWSRKGNCEVKGLWHFVGMMRSVVEAYKKNNGVIIRHHYNTEWGIPYRVEAIDVSQIDVSKEDDKTNTLNGLVKDDYGRITGMWLYTDSKRRDSSLVDMAELDYFMVPWLSLTQYTAITKLAAILPTIDKLDQYSDAELQAALERAKAGRYWKTSMFDDVLKIIRNEKDDTSRYESITTLMGRLKKQGVLKEGLTPIPLGDHIENADHPSASVYPNLVQNAKEDISAAAGKSALTVYKNAGQANYSAGKMMLQFASIGWGIDFDDVQNHVLDPILYRLIQIGAATGALDIPNFNQDPEEYFQLEYMRVTEIDIEPSKTAAADGKKLANGTHSLREIARRRGRDIEDVYREQAEDERLKREIFSEYGVTPPTEGNTNAN